MKTRRIFIRWNTFGTDLQIMWTRYIYYSAYIFKLIHMSRMENEILGYPAPPDS